MLISEYMRILKISVGPALFCAAALGGLVLHISMQRNEAKPSQASAIAADDPFAQEASLSAATRNLVRAARNGDLAARLEMAKRYAEGRGVAKSDARAFAYFRSIANQYLDADPREARAQQIAEAFRVLARYYLTGISETGLKRDPVYAFSLLHYSASYFGDPVSQFELARMILRGDAVTRNARIAAQWLLNSSRKGYAPAQALLGSLLWNGEGVGRVAGDGLGLMAVARRNAAPNDRKWVDELYESARRTASPNDILEANAFIAQESTALQWKLTDEILVQGGTMDERSSSELQDKHSESRAGAAAPAGFENRVAEATPPPAGKKAESDIVSRTFAGPVHFAPTAGETTPGGKNSKNAPSQQ